MRRLPAFSVVVCNHNYAEFIGEALESCLAQDYPKKHFEVVVVDDGSDDDSRRVIESYAKKSSQIVPVYQENRGQAAALAAGVARAKNGLVCLLDSDDVFLSGKLRALADRLALLPRIPENFFLCHDVHIWEQPPAAAARKTLFQLLGVRASDDKRPLSEIDGRFQFSTPCGQVLSRGLAAAILRALPAEDWKLCADGPIAHAAALGAGAVHDLKTPLAMYRFHGRNGYARIENGRYAPKIDPGSLGPKLIRFLESYVAGLGLAGAALEERRDYLSRLRGPSERAH